MTRTGPGTAVAVPTAPTASPRTTTGVRRLRGGALWAGGIALLLGSVAVAVTIGPARVSVADVWSAVAAHLGWGRSQLSPIRDGIIWNLRMPRTLLAAVCGAGLAGGGRVNTSDAPDPEGGPDLGGGGIRAS
ncbi:iron chelate uptake ABC transporter family permease subunit, partial [Streptomyces sp. NPDC055663]